MPPAHRRAALRSRDRPARARASRRGFARRAAGQGMKRRRRRRSRYPEHGDARRTAARGQREDGVVHSHRRGFTAPAGNSGQDGPESGPNRGCIAPCPAPHSRSTAFPLTPIAARAPARRGRARPGRTPHAQRTRQGNQPLSPAARRQPGALAGLGRRRPRPGTHREQAGAAVDRLCRVPLVPRHGPRELRGPGHRRGDEPQLHPDQGRPRGAPRPRCHLPGRAAALGRARRLAAHHVPHPRRHAVLGRHLLPARTALRPARLPHPARAGRGDLRQGERQGRAERRRHARRARPHEDTPPPAT